MVLKKKRMNKLRSTIILVSCFILSNNLLAQTGYIEATFNITESENQPITIRIFKKGNKKCVQSFTVDEKTMHFEIDSLESEMYFMQLDALGYYQLIRGIDLKSSDSVNMIIDFPELECTFDNKNKECPHGHKNNVCRIIYGETTSKRLYRRSKKGKIHLGGCSISDCDPSYFCNEHYIIF